MSQITELKSIQIILFFLLFGSPIVATAQKTDSLYHINGNILLGEIKKLEYGILDFKMDGMGTIKVEIEKIKTLKSNKLFELVTTHGRLIYGFIDSSNVAGSIEVNSGYDSSIIHLYQVVEIFPIKKTFFLRLSGRVNFGFNYTKASNVGRVNFDWDLKYRNKKTSVSIFSSSVETFTPNDTLPPSSKYDISISMERKIKGIWSGITYISGNQNSELGLDLRLKFAVGMLGDIVHTNFNRLYLITAIVPNYELADNQTSRTSNFEGQFSISYEIFKRNLPKIALGTKLDYYPSFTQKRHRIDYNLDLNVEIISNFTIGLKFYYNYDSNPAAIEAANDDYGFTTTIGYSFN